MIDRMKGGRTCAIFSEERFHTPHSVPQTVDFGTSHLTFYRRTNLIVLKRTSIAEKEEHYALRTANLSK